MKLFYKNICLCLALIFFSNYYSLKAYASRSTMIAWTIEATINGKSVNLFYYGSNFSFLDFNWNEEKSDKKNQRFFIPDQKWTNDYKKFFLPKESVIDFREIDPNDKARKYYESQYYPEILISKDGFINLKNEDEIIVKKIYSYSDDEVFFLPKENFEKVKNSFKNRFQINTKMYINNLETFRIFIFLNIYKKYLLSEVLEIIRKEGEKILIHGSDSNLNQQFPPQGFNIEYNFIKNNFEYFKELLLRKYGIILIEFYSSGE